MPCARTAGARTPWRRSRSASGVSVGEVSNEDGDDHGVAVIEAARLEALAAPGEILATDLVERLGFRRADAAFEDVGSHSLKGLEKPVSIVRVLDVAADATAPPMPKALSLDRRFPLVGRSAAMEQLVTRWNVACSGSPRTLLVTGQPGMGKTRLIAHAAEHAHDDGAIVLAGICDSELAVPYQPFAMALNEPLLTDEQLATRDLHTRRAPRPAVPRQPGDPPGRPGPGRSLRAVRGCRGAASSGCPTCNPSCWCWKISNGRLRRRCCCCGISSSTSTKRDCSSSGRTATRRPRPTRSCATCSAEIHGSGSASKIELQALSEHDVAEMIATLVPTAPADNVGTFARRVRDESAGNAFFVCELLDHLATTGQLERLVTVGRGDRLPIPDSVRDVVGQRLGRLSPMPRSSCRLPRWSAWRSTSTWWPRWPAVGHDRRSTGR